MGNTFWLLALATAFFLISALMLKKRGFDRAANAFLVICFMLTFGVAAEIGALSY
jgi:hypothetical protein